MRFINNLEGIDIIMFILLLALLLQYNDRVKINFYYNNFVVINVTINYLAAMIQTSTFLYTQKKCSSHVRRILKLESPFIANNLYSCKIYKNKPMFFLSRFSSFSFFFYEEYLFCYLDIIYFLLYLLCTKIKIKN